MMFQDDLKEGEMRGWETVFKQYYVFVVLDFRFIVIFVLELQIILFVEFQRLFLEIYVFMIFMYYVFEDGRLELEVSVIVQFDVGRI